MGIVPLPEGNALKTNGISLKTCASKSTVRFLREIRIEPVGNELQLYFTGNGFLHNMVRILVGTLIEVGRHDRASDSIPSLFGGKRADAGFLAPAQGLCLEEVQY